MNRVRRFLENEIVGKLHATAIEQSINQPIYRHKLVRLAGVVSSLIVALVLFSPNTASAVTKTSTGTGSWNTAGTWSPSGVPASTDDVVIRNGDTVTINTSPTVASIQVGQGTSGTLTVGDNNTDRTVTVTGNVTVNAGATFNTAGNGGNALFIGGNLTVSGTFDMNIAGADLDVTFNGTTQTISGAGATADFNVLTINSSSTVTLSRALTTASTSLNGTLQSNSGGSLTGTITVGATGVYKHNQDGGAIITATWNAGSACEVIGQVGTTPPTGLTQSFSNFTWNSTSQTGDVSLGANLDTVNGDLTITSTGSGSVRLLNTGTNTTTVGGNFSQTGASFFICGTTATATLTISGSFSLSGGTLTMSGGSGTGTINVAGDFSHTAGTITETSSGSGTIVFNGGVKQTYTSGGTVSNTINFTVNSGTTLQMGTAATPAIITGGGTFTLSSGATLGVTSADGITTSACGTGATCGNIRSTARTFTAGASYIYNGNVNQDVGTGLTAASPANLTIANTGGGGSNTVSLGTNTTISGLLTVSSGVLDQGTGNTLSTGSITVSGGTFTGGNSAITLTNTGGSLTVSSGTFTSTSGTLTVVEGFSHSGGTFTHNSGLVTFTGNASTLTASVTTTFNNVTFNTGADADVKTISGLGFLVAGTLTFTNGHVNGAIEAQGNVVVGAAGDGGTAALTFTGSAAQTFTFNGGGVIPSGTWTINKSVGSSLTLGSAVNLNSGATPVTITSGTLDQGASFNFTCGAISIAVNGTLRNFGTGSLTLGGNVTNNGIVNYNGNGGVCGDSTRITIGTVSGTHSWSGAGNFKFLDVNVNHQITTPGLITAYGSVDGGSNTGWTINTDCTGAPTAIEMVGYSANYDGDGKALIRWETGFEVDNLGFNIYRQEGAERVRVNHSLIAGSALFAQPGTKLTAGRSYAWRDNPSKDSNASYWLEEIDMNGASHWHGPILVGSAPAGKFGVSSAQSMTVADLNGDAAQHGPTLPREQTAKLVMVAAAPATSPWTLGSQQAVKLSVKHEGFYRVSKADLVAAGLNPASDPRYLQLFVDGQEQPMNVVLDDKSQLSAIEFYGVGLDTPSTDTHVYWLATGYLFGKRIQTLPAQDGAPGPGSFQYTVERRDRSLYVSGIRNGDTENFFGAVVVSTPVDQVLNLPHVDQSSQATLEVAVQGLSLLSHHVSVSLNGTSLGAIDFTAQANGVGTFTIPSGSLQEGQNTVTLVGQTDVLDVSLVDHIRVTYSHTYSADGNALKLTASGLQQVSVEGFTTEDIRVIDVTDPAAAKEVSGKVVQQTGGTFSMTFAAPGNGSRALLAFAGDQVRAVDGAVANGLSNWRSKGNAADLVIFTHKSLLDSFRPLQALRQAQGLKVAVIDVEDAYDEFSYGNKTPQAIKDLLAYTPTHWITSPKYVLMAGGASFDPKNYAGQGALDLVPTKLIDTQFMETASDDWFADFNNSGLATMALGRLPANTPAEASAMVSKIIGYDASAGSRSITLVADQNEGFDFEAATSQLKPLIPASIATTEIDRGKWGTDAAKQQLLAAIAAGQKIVNYAGHGSTTIWRGNLFTSDDARALTNAGRLPFFVVITCLNGLFQDANLDGLAPALMKTAQGGAVAVWASSALTDPALGQPALNQQLYRQLFLSLKGTLQPATIGDATLKAKAAVTDPDIRRTWILFGDPTTRLK